MPIYDAAMKYKEEGTPLIVIAGKEYGTGSSRDWAAKGPALLGVRAVIAESFERIHRSNLIGMGILPLQFDDGQNYRTLGLTGFEVFDIDGITEDLSPRKKITVSAISSNGVKKNFTVVCRIDTPNEVDYYKNQGILQFVIRSLFKQNAQLPEQQIKPAIENKTRKYRILFKGEIDDGQDLQTVKDKMAKLFKVAPGQINKLFLGKPVILSTNLDHSAAQRYITEIKNVGALCYFEPIQAPPVMQADNTAKKIPVPAPIKTVVQSPSRPASPNVKNIIKSASVTPANSKNDLLKGILVSIGMSFLLLIYLFIPLYIASSTFDHIFDNIDIFSTQSIIFALPIYILPILIGLTLVASM